jgi:hypothetical protein
VYAEGRRAAARVRAFVDFAVERLRADPSLGWPARAGTAAATRGPNGRVHAARRSGK